MGLIVTIFGGILIYASFDDGSNQRTPWGSERLAGAIIGAVLVIAGLVYAAVRNDD